MDEHGSALTSLHRAGESGRGADAGLEEIWRRDRLVVVLALIVLAGLSWADLVYMAASMGETGAAMTVPRLERWGAADLLMLFVMWVVMMVAMMVPSSAPVVLLVARLNRKRREQVRPYAPTGVFLLGYLAVWTAFSLVATLAQWGLHEAALLSPMMVSTSPVLGGTLLVLAGVYQWTPLKHACLHECRSPLGFISSEWREGVRGAFAMGLKHGWFCTGCCWSLMALLFVAGVMNLLWVAVIATFVLVEKVGPAGEWIGRATGLLLVAGGAWMLSGFLA